MACQIETVTLPSWWEGATTVTIRDGSSNTVYTGSRANVELLPQGVAFPSKLYPWSYIFSIDRVN